MAAPGSIQSKPPSSPSSSRLPLFPLPVRAQLVLGSVLVLMLLLCAFGLAVRYIASTTLMIGVDSDLRHQLVIATAPRHRRFGGPPPFGNLEPLFGSVPPLFDAHPGDRRGGPPFGGSGSGPLDGDDHGPGGPGPGPGSEFGPSPDFGAGTGDHRKAAQTTGARGARSGWRQGQGQGQEPSGALLLENPYAPRRFDSTGQARDPDSQNLPVMDPIGLQMALRGDTVFSTVVESGQRVRVLSEPDLGGPPGQPHGAAQAAYPLGGVDRALQSVDNALLMLIPLALLCAGLGGWWITGRALTRVGQITRAAAAINARNLSDRLPATGRDEFSQLARTFNGLLDRVDAAFQEQRRFTADASHELKTPLTVIQGTTSLALSLGNHAALDRAAIQEIDCAAKLMAHLVQDLLYLARADASLSDESSGSGSGTASARRVELLLADPIQRAINTVAPRSPARITFQQSPDAEPICVLASESEITRLFLNLLENAARYTPEGGAITIALSLADSGRTAVAAVADTGIGIAPEHLPRLTDRFYRVDDSRTRALESNEAGGSGLGLAICKSIAESHGGTLAITSEEGVGTTVTVRLPACAEDDNSSS